MPADLDVPADGPRDDGDICGDRCPSVFGTREVACTLPKGHAAHRSGGTAWEALCDEVAQQAERDAAALARVRAAHPRVDDGYGPECRGCGNHVAGIASWPCPTVRALDVPADGEQPGGGNE